MDIVERIEYDANDLEAYFQKLFEIMSSTDVINTNAHFSSYAKSDMACNIYSFLDFWLKEICRTKKTINELSLSYNDIKAGNELAGYNKYLSKVAGIDTSSIKTSYDALQNLREVRNCIIHAGAHKDKGRIGSIKGVSLLGSIIVVSEWYIFDTLSHAKQYLSYVASA